MGNLLNLRLWINTRPGSLQPEIQQILAIFILLLLVSTVVFSLIKNRKRSFYNKIWQKLATFSLSNFVIGLLLLFFTYELIPFLSMRLWFLVWGLGILVWLFFIARTYLKIPEIKNKLAKEAEFKKYIP